jgi:hypothetical protein
MSLEMAVLGLCELALSFLVIYGMLAMPGASRPGGGIQCRGEACGGAGHSHFAAVLALTIGCTAAAIGLIAERSATSGAAC